MATGRKAPRKAVRSKRAAPAKVMAKRVPRSTDSLVLDEINKLVGQESALKEQLAEVSTRLQGLRLAHDALQGKPARVKTRAGKPRAVNGSGRGLSDQVYEKMRSGFTKPKTLASALGADLVTVRNAINWLRKTNKVASVEGQRGTYKVL